VDWFLRPKGSFVHPVGVKTGPFSQFVIDSRLLALFWGFLVLLQMRTVSKSDSCLCFTLPYLLYFVHGTVTCHSRNVSGLQIHFTLRLSRLISSAAYAKIVSFAAASL